MTKMRLRSNELPVEAGWRLIRWYAETGSNEFTFSCLAAATQEGRFCAAAEQALASFAVGFDRRPPTTLGKNEASLRKVKLWRLNEQSLRVLQQLLPDGLFTDRQGSDEGWIEDLTVYQDGQLRVGVITHEKQATIHLTDSEQEELRGLGVLPRD